jgi:hypothetical protein
MIQLTLYECITIHGSKLNDNKIETTNTKLLAQMVNEVYKRTDFKRIRV